MVRKLVLLVLAGTLLCGFARAQFKISSNEKLFLAENPEAETTESVTSTVRNFFLLAQTEHRSEWEQLLSSSCFKEGLPRDNVNHWFDLLAEHDTDYHILDVTSPKTNQKIILYTSSGDANEDKTLVLVKEKNKWKVFSAGL